MTRGVRLKKIEDVRRFVARATNLLNRDEITIGKARCLGYLCGLLAGIIKDTDIETRLEALEARINESKK